MLGNVSASALGVSRMWCAQERWLVLRGALASWTMRPSPHGPWLTKFFAAREASSVSSEVPASEDAEMMGWDTYDDDYVGS